MDIAKITVRLNGENIPATVTDKGTVILPSGEEKQLTPKQFEMIKERLKEDSAKPAEEPAQNTEPEETTPAAEEQASAETSVSAPVSTFEEPKSVQEKAFSAPAAPAPVEKPVAAEPETTAPAAVEAPVTEKAPADENKEAATAEAAPAVETEKIPVSEIGKKKDDKPAKKKKPASFFVAIIFVILFIAETAAFGVGMVMGYVQVEGVNTTSTVQHNPQYIPIPQSLLDADSNSAS